MRVDELKLTNFRGLLDTEIKFQPGFNLIVGVMARQVIVLDALRVLLSQVLPMFTPAPRFNLGFDIDDIMIGRASSQAQIIFSCHGSEPYSYVVHKNRVQRVSNEGGSLREQTTETPTRVSFSVARPGRALDKGPVEFKNVLISRWFCILCRALTFNRRDFKVGKKSNPGYFGALVQDRGLRIQDIVLWWRAKEQIASEANQRYKRKATTSRASSVGTSPAGFF